MNIISLTAPKSGSHMVGYALGLGTKPTWHVAATSHLREFRTEDEVIDILDAWDRRKGIWTHIPYSIKMSSYLKRRFQAIVFTRRDPRDIVVSLGHYMDKFPQNTLNWTYGGMQLNKMGWHQRMFHIIEEYGAQLLKFAPWIHQSGYQIKYEDCIDDRERVFDVLRANLIAGGLRPPSLDQMVQSSLVKHKISYRRAKYGDWKFELNDKHMDHAKVHLAEAMEAYGYGW